MYVRLSSSLRCGLPASTLCPSHPIVQTGSLRAPPLDSADGQVQATTCNDFSPDLCPTGTTFLGSSDACDPSPCTFVSCCGSEVAVQLFGDSFQDAYSRTSCGGFCLVDVRSTRISIPPLQPKAILKSYEDVANAPQTLKNLKDQLGSGFQDFIGSVEDLGTHYFRVRRAACTHLFMSGAGRPPQHRPPPRTTTTTCLLDLHASVLRPPFPADSLLQDLAESTVVVACTTMMALGHLQLAMIRLAQSVAYRPFRISEDIVDQYGCFYDTSALERASVTFMDLANVAPAQARIACCFGRLGLTSVLGALTAPHVLATSACLRCLGRPTLPSPAAANGHSLNCSPTLNQTFGAWVFVDNQRQYYFPKVLRNYADLIAYDSSRQMLLHELVRGQRMGGWGDGAMQTCPRTLDWFSELSPC